MRGGLRTRLTLTVAIGSALLIGALCLGFNLALRSSLDADANRVARERAESALETVAVRDDGTLRLIEAPAAQDAGSGIWIFTADGSVLEKPPAAAQVQRLAGSLAGESDAFADDESSDTRLYARAIRDESGGPAGSVVASLSLDPYEQTARQALLASLAFSALVWIGIVVAGRFLVDRALRPVARMTREATDWSEHDLDHRFAAGEPYDEITELAAAFDSMLDRLASSLRHEQRLSAEISHELRTPLAAILAETELALADPATGPADRAVLERIAERALALNRILETLLAAARAETGAEQMQSPVMAAIEQVAHEASAIDVGGQVAVTLPADAGGLTADLDQALVERILSPLVENAYRFAASSISISAEQRGPCVRIVVTDDGPGVAPEETEAIFEPGIQGERAAARGSRGAGLGLALSRRLARSAGGGLELDGEGRGRGARFVLELPAPPEPARLGAAVS